VIRPTKHSILTCDRVSTDNPQPSHYPDAKTERAIPGNKRERDRITLAALFVAFLEVSLCAVGGPLVWARRMTVEKRRWLSDQELCIGTKFRGIAGALAALFGFVLIPWTVGFAVGVVLLHYAYAAALYGALRGIAAAAAGLIIGTGVRLLLPQRRRPSALLFAALAFAGLAFVHLPLILVVAALIPLSIAAAGRESPPEAA